MRESNMRSNVSQDLVGFRTASPGGYVRGYVLIITIYLIYSGNQTGVFFRVFFRVYKTDFVL